MADTESQAERQRDNELGKERETQREQERKERERRPCCASKQGLQAPGPELLGRSLGIPRTEKWPKTEHADDWVYCDWV